MKRLLIMVGLGKRFHKKDFLSEKHGNIDKNLWIFTLPTFTLCHAFKNNKMT
jgi:hypothetical protein